MLMSSSALWLAGDRVSYIGKSASLEMSQLLLLFHYISQLISSLILVTCEAVASVPCIRFALSCLDDRPPPIREFLCLGLVGSEIADAGPLSVAHWTEFEAQRALSPSTSTPPSLDPCIPTTPTIAVPSSAHPTRQLPCRSLLSSSLSPNNYFIRELVLR